MSTKKTICFDPDFNHGWLPIRESEVLGEYAVGVDAVAFCTDDNPVWYVGGKLAEPYPRYMDRLRFDPDWSTQRFFMPNPHLNDTQLLYTIMLRVLLDELAEQE